MTYAFEFQGVLHELWLARCVDGSAAGSYRLHCNEVTGVKPSVAPAVALHPRDDGGHVLQVGDRRWPVDIAVDGDEIHIHLDGQAHVLSHIPALVRWAATGESSSEAQSRAPMPGSVIALAVQPGQRVARGELLMVIESMKMETTICAGIDGVVHEVHAQPGQTFEREALLVTLAQLPDSAQETT